MLSWYDGSLTCLLHSKKPAKYFCYFSYFDKHLFLSDLENIDFNQLINTLQTLSDKHAPVKKTIE